MQQQTLVSEQPFRRQMLTFDGTIKLSNNKMDSDVVLANNACTKDTAHWMQIARETLKDWCITQVRVWGCDTLSTSPQIRTFFESACCRSYSLGPMTVELTSLAPGLASALDAAACWSVAVSDRYHVCVRFSLSFLSFFFFFFFLKHERIG